MVAKALHQHHMKSLRHARGVIGAIYELIDQLYTLVCRLVSEESARLRGGRNTTTKIEPHAPQELGIIGDRRGSLAASLGVDQLVDLLMQWIGRAGEVRRQQDGSRKRGPS